MSQIEISSIELIYHPDYLALVAGQPCRVLSSAVLNGGLCDARSLLNMRVDKNAPPPYPEPAATLQQKAQALALPPTCIGMMTAASMKSLGQAQRQTQQTSGTLEVQCWVTAGLSNLRRCGDPADDNPLPGTINIWLWVNQPLSDAALAEALILLTESKVTAIRDASLFSPLSGQPASGTGTDSHAVFCPLSAGPAHPPGQLNYCGKHTQLGEMIGQAVLAACEKSIALCLQAEISYSAPPEPELIPQTSDATSGDTCLRD